MKELNEVQAIVNVNLEEGATFRELENIIVMYIQDYNKNIGLAYKDHPSSCVHYAKQLILFLKALEQLKEMEGNKHG